MLTVYEFDNINTYTNHIYICDSGNNFRHINYLPFTTQIIWIGITYHSLCYLPANIFALELWGYRKSKHVVHNLPWQIREIAIDHEHAIGTCRDLAQYLRLNEDRVYTGKFIPNTIIIYSLYI
jgi:hypothetical protein